MKLLLAVLLMALTAHAYPMPEVGVEPIKSGGIVPEDPNKPLNTPRSPPRLTFNGKVGYDRKVESLVSTITANSNFYEGSNYKIGGIATHTAVLGGGRAGQQDLDGALTFSFSLF